MTLGVCKELNNRKHSNDSWWLCMQKTWVRARIVQWDFLNQSSTPLLMSFELSG